jgi:hypothetical protein
MLAQPGVHRDRRVREPPRHHRQRGARRPRSKPWSLFFAMVPTVATSGAMGFDDLKWIRPVRPGDVL